MEAARQLKTVVVLVLNRDLFSYEGSTKQNPSPSLLSFTAEFFFRPLS